MEKRVLFAIIASFLVIYFWQALFLTPQPKPASAPASQTQQAGQSGAAADASGAPTPVPGAQSEAAGSGAVVPPVPAGPSAPVLVGATAERDVRVETADVVAVFTNRGGRLKSWRLEKYHDETGAPLELVEQNPPAGQPLPFSLAAPDPAVSRTLNTSLYAVTSAPSGPVAGSPGIVRFEYRDASGLSATKEFRIQPTSYIVSFDPEVTLDDKAVPVRIEWGPALADSERKSSFAVKARGLLSHDKKEQRIPPAEIAKQATYEGNFTFAGVDDHYFMSVALNPGQSTITYHAVTVPGTTPAKELVAYALDPGVRDKPIRFYVGPKEFDQLAAIDRELTRAVHFGWFSPIVVPLLRSLKWINGYVGNYGWSIIILTGIINLLILPLRHKSVVSMRKMQEVQPEAKAIQDRYAKLKATDPAKQKMNQELMALYKERGVNPAGGCVPMLIPFPILFAFYSLLTTAIELRGQPFMLWIHDLSAPDPYYVTPILMGATQLWQTWIQPAAGADPAQRKMMLIMPLVFTFLFIGYPAGVALYWFASNLWGIGQQYLTNYLIGPPKVHQVRPAAERRVKKVGSGKTEAAREN